MGHSYHAEEKFWMALRTLTGADSQRRRLENAYTDHLSDLQDAELPSLHQARFSQLRDTVTHERKLHPEIAIAAMSDEEVAAAVRMICDLHEAVMNSSRPYPFPR